MSVGFMCVAAQEKFHTENFKFSLPYHSTRLADEVKFLASFYSCRFFVSEYFIH
jgi:hypothetical protein